MDGDRVVASQCDRYVAQGDGCGVVVNVTYLKTEIDVRPAMSGCGETAFVCLDGERRCFLGGLAEAKQFLKARSKGALTVRVRPRGSSR